MRKILIGVALICTVGCLAWWLLAGSGVRVSLGSPGALTSVGSSGLESEEPGSEPQDSGGDARVALKRKSGSPVLEEEATMVLLEVGTGQPVAQVKCRFQSASLQGELIRETKDDGSLHLPAAVWQIESLDPAWKIAEEVIRIPREGTKIAWAMPRREILIRTVTPFGVAIANVDVLASTFPQSPVSSFDSWWLREWTRLGKTDSQGELLVHPPPGVGLIIRALSTGSVPISTACSDPKVKEIRLVLVEDKTRLLAIDVRDLQTGAALDDVRVHGPGGPIPIVRREGSRLFLRSSSLGPKWDRKVVVFADGYCPSKLDRGALREEGSLTIGLYKACRLSIDSLPEAMEATIGFRLIDLEEAKTRPLIPRAKIFHGKTIELTAPRNVRLEIYSVREDGRSDAVLIRPKGSEELVTLEYEDRREALTLTLVDESGAAVMHARARLNSENGLYAWVAGDEQGLLRVQDPGRVIGLRIYARGYGTIRINPMNARSSAKERSGSLRLVLKRASPVRITLEDQNASPVPGMRVVIHGDDSRFAMRLDPRLGGSRATAHPAWSRKNQPNQHLETDGAGVIETGLSHGRYTIKVDIPAIYKARGWRPSGYPIAYQEFKVNGNTKVHFTIPRPVPVKIKVYSFLTRKPLESILVTSDQVGVGTRGARQINEAELWVPSMIRRLRVGAPGYRTKEVVIPVEPKGPLDFDVYLESTGPGTIEVLGLPKELAGKKVLISAFRRTPPVERGYVGDVWQRQILLSAQGKQEIRIPHGGPLYMRLHDVRVGGSTYSFKPLNALWVAAGHLKFRVYKKGR